MWKGVFPAVTTKFTVEGALDKAEMERCFALQIDAGVDGLIVCGSLGEAMTLDPAEKLEILAVARSVAGGKPVLMTVCDSATRRAVQSASEAAAAGASGIMLLPGVPYRSLPEETLAHMAQVVWASDLPVMIYNNPVAYGVDLATDQYETLAADRRVVAIKESSDDVRRVSDLINHFGDRFDIFCGVDNLALEAQAMGAVGWVAGLCVAFPAETVAIWRLAGEGRFAEAREIYRWFRPLLDLDVSARLVQNIKLVEKLVTGSNDRVRLPRLPLDREDRVNVEAVVARALETRPSL